MADPVTIYTTPEKVAALLGLVVFGDASKPAKATVENIILRAEDRIDYYTMRTWKSKIRTERHQVFQRDVRLDRADPTAISLVKLVYGGQTLTLTENADFHFLKSTGTLYLVAPWSLFGPSLFRWTWWVAPELEVTYTYGKAFASSDEQFLVEEVATKLAAIEIIVNHDLLAVVKGGVDRVPLESKVRIWREDIEEGLDRLRRLVIQ